MQALNDYGEAEFRLTKRLNEQLLVYRSAWNSSLFYVFRCKETRKNGSRTFTCRGCEKLGKTKSLTVRDGHVLSQNHPEHGHDYGCHPVTEDEIELTSLKRGMMKDTRRTGRPARDVYRETSRNIAKKLAGTPHVYLNVLQRWPKFSSVKSCLNHHRRIQAVPVPNSRQIPPELRVTQRGKDVGPTSFFHEERWLLYEGVQSHMLIFADDNDLLAIQRSSYIVADGTFKFCPNTFYQLYTIFAYVSGEGLPVAFVLLPNKTELSYTEMWEAIKSGCEARFGPFPPGKIFLTDFELASIQPGRRIFVLCQFRGCSFHFRQALLKNIGTMGLIVVYKNDSVPEVRKWLRMIMAMCLLPVQEIFAAWDFLKTPPVVQDPVLSGQLVAYSSYVERTWISGSYPPHTWSHFDHDGPRTTNLAEGFHNKLTHDFSRSHPTLTTFLHWLQGEHAVNQIRLFQLQNGAAPKPRDKTYVNLDQRINREKQRLSQQLASLHLLPHDPFYYQAAIVSFLRTTSYLFESV